jgi:hypothetical protein
VEPRSKPAEAGVEKEPPVKAGVEGPPIKAGIEEEPLIEAVVEPAEAMVEKRPVKVAVEAAMAEAAVVEGATMVLCLAGPGRHENGRPRKEQGPAERDCFPKHDCASSADAGLEG